MRKHMKHMKLAALPSTLLAGAVVLGGCVAVEPDEAAEEWTAELDEAAEEWTTELDEAAEEWTAEPDEAWSAWATDVELEGEAESSSEQPGLAAAYNGKCGSGYRVIDKASVQGGTVYLTWNSSTGKNCVVTVRNKKGKKIQMCAGVSLAGKPWVQDCGSYTIYAGPVYVYARKKCIDWYGSIANSSVVQNNEHCS